jgi:hypothetical protein
MRCVNICPHRAIETAHGFSGLILFLAYALLFPFLITFLKNQDILDIKNQSEIFKQIWPFILGAILLLILFISYRILHYFMKYKIVESVITYSSLSKFKFWRRYKPPKKFNT